MDRVEKCGTCYWFELCGQWGPTGYCMRYPQKVPKEVIDFCGEFKEKKVVEVLREGKER
jgi:hypothetical protein